VIPWAGEFPETIVPTYVVGADGMRGLWFPSMDAARLAFVGHSYNASTGGYLAGIDKRFKAFVLMAGSLSDTIDLESDAYRKYRQQVGPARFDAFINKYAWLDPGVYLPHAAPAVVLMQYATKEDFLTIERARRYAALVSEPKQFKVYEAAHALNAAARRDRVEFLREQLRLRAVDWAAIDKVPELPQPPDTARVQRKTTTAPDGVSIVYSAAGAGDTAIVFIHGGLADRSFFDAQFDRLSDDYRVIAIDLAGHGESGTNRTAWGMPQFGADVKAVVDAEHLKRVVLFGNSLGGPVAIEAALLVPDRVAGVVGIDTFQDIGHPDTPEYARIVGQLMRQRAEAFRADYAGSMRKMVKALFHPDADPWIVAEAERRMMRTSPETAHALFLGMAEYDPQASARKLTVPLCAINGDLYPTNVEQIRTVKPDFHVIVMKHMGHYPMIERPEEFSALVRTVTRDLTSNTK
jgi:pimeloyl-ACP methyl ester carboxylesterase